MHVSEQPKLPEGWHGTSVPPLPARAAGGCPTQKGLDTSWLNKAFTLPCRGSSKGLRLLPELLEKGSPSCTAFHGRGFTAVSYFLGLRVFPHRPHKPQMEFKDLLIPHHSLVSPLPFHLPFASRLRHSTHRQVGVCLAQGEVGVTFRVTPWSVERNTFFPWVIHHPRW